MQNLKLGFHGNFFWRNALALKSARYKIYLGKRLFRYCCLQQSFLCKTVSRISFNSYRSGDKRLLSDLIREWGYFHGQDKSFPKNLSSRLKFQKTETGFCRWKSNGYHNNIFLSSENPCTFLRAKEKSWRRILKTNCESSQNQAEKKLMQSKTMKKLPV